MPGRNRRAGWLVGSVGLWSALLLQPAVPGRCAEPRQPNLQGSWRLNDELTARLDKDARAEAGEDQGAGGNGDHHHTGLGSVGPTGGGHDELGMGDWSPGKERHENESRREVVALLDSLTIVQQAGPVATVTITDQTGHSRVLKTDGSKLRDQGPAGGAQLRASWDRDGSLVIDVKPDKGTRRTESYLVSNDGKHLYLTITLPNQLSPVLRAYDRLPAPAASAAPPAAGAPAASATPPVAGAPAAAAAPPSAPAPAAPAAAPPPPLAPGAA